ncbi:glycosyltransferase family 2 protein [Ornithinimicrobium cryptoxanthini]|uniref:glycosyltransferase family 2 protein n=1 Tax=Ornithinimicrobium cryptoxanthini TaxID=2934161 RepID=UPI002118948C|nr:glycosyltransferase [Ornithinimicrobium cryptoxanthini]
MTKVSVVVPVYNVEPYLPRCLDSLLAQTERDFEIIVVNDGATDRSGQIADRYAARDRRVRVVHRVNGGLSAARNSGLEVASGEFISLVDGDDWVDAEMLERMVARLRDTGADVVVAGMHVDHHDNSEGLLSSKPVYPPDLVVDSDGPIPERLVNDTLVNLLGYAWNKMYRRELITTNGLRFAAGVSLIEDILFNAEALTKASRVALLEGAFVHYVQRPRVTLGTKTYPDQLDLRLRAIQAAEEALAALGADGDRAQAVTARRSQVALVMAVRSAASQEGTLSQQSDTLRRLLSADGARVLQSLAQLRPPERCRDAVTLTLLRRGRLRMALVPMRTLLALEDTRRSLFSGRSRTSHS